MSRHFGLAPLSDGLVAQFTTMFESHVETGMKRLNEQAPGWPFLIDLDALDQSSCTRCVLGQLYGNYVSGCEKVGVPPFDDPFWEHGFRIGPLVPGLTNYHHAYDILTNVWKEKIQAITRGSGETPATSTV